MTLTDSRPSFDLSGKTILVTGATSGIGKQIALSVAAMGAKVFVTGRNEKRLDEVAADLGEHLAGKLSADLLVSENRMALISAVPPLDGVVHSAGIVKYTPIRAVSEKNLKELVAINYEAPMLLTQALVSKKLIRTMGSLVFLSSTSGLVGARGIPVYAGCKGALISSSRVIALELAPQKIRSNCVAPAMVRTPMFDTAVDSISAEAMAEHEKDYPLGFGDPIDVAGAVVYLLSDAARWITGQTIVLDGGVTIH